MDLRATLMNFYWRMESVIAPGLRYSQSLYEDVLAEHVHRRTRWLDVGCGHQVLPGWRGDRERELVAGCGFVVGADADVPSLQKHRTIEKRAAADIGRLPFATGSFNLVTANMVVEHLDRPLVQFQEVSRVLEQDGTFLLHTPHKLGYSTIAAILVPSFLKRALIYLLEGRREEDVFSTFYRANTRAEILSLAVRSGFRVTSVKLLVSSAEFASIPPLAVLELIWIRLLMSRTLAPLRTNIIAVLQKSGTPPAEPPRRDWE